MSTRLPPPFDIVWQEAQFIEFEADFEARTVRLRVSDADDEETEFALSGVSKVEMDQAMGFEIRRVEHRTLEGRQALMFFDEDDDEMACLTFRAAARVHLPD